MDATATVTDVERVGPDTVAITFETPAGFEAAPGQFVKLAAEIDGKSYARFYTLSSPSVDETFEVTVGIDPEEAGDFSRHLDSLAAGDRIDVTGPFGDDHYEGEDRVVLLVGGPGIGPAVGIAEAALADGHEAAIVYKDDTPAHEARLDELRARGADVHVTDGPLDDHVEAVVTGEQGEQVFVYGFADFLSAALDALESADGLADDAKVENFG